MNSEHILFRYIRQENKTIIKHWDSPKSKILDQSLFPKDVLQEGFCLISVFIAFDIMHGVFASFLQL